MRHEIMRFRDAVAIAGPYANNLHLTPPTSYHSSLKQLVGRAQMQCVQNNMGSSNGVDIRHCKADITTSFQTPQCTHVPSLTSLQAAENKETGTATVKFSLTQSMSLSLQQCITFANNLHTPDDVNIAAEMNDITNTLYRIANAC